MLNENSKIKKIVLAYSGGLDTSVILKWLQDSYQCEVVTFTADISGDDVRLRGQISSTNTTTVTVVRRLLNV